MFKFLGVLPQLQECRGLDMTPIQRYEYPGWQPIAEVAGPLMPKSAPEPSKPFVRNLILSRLAFHINIDRIHIQAGMWFVSQAKLDSVLRQELLKLGCAIESGRRLTSLTRHEGFIHANICGENKDYVPEKVGVSFLIGADGAKGKDCTLRRYISLIPFRSNTNGNRTDLECSPI
jgi:2-polyprenyl-6-methoxyphenol hydroxylase-like FAD-dependent oxidoreductase